MHVVSRAIVDLPDVVALPVLCAAVVVSLTVLFGVFTPWVVVPAIIVGTVLTWRWRPPRFRVETAWTSALVAVAVIVCWFAVNLRFASEWVDVTRDPGFLTLQGLWLSQHPSSDIPIGGAADVAGAVDGARVDSIGYFDDGDGVLHAQGAKLVPGLVAIGGWIAGTAGVLGGNLVIGAFALLTFFGFARRVVGQWWGLAAMIPLAMCMPMVAFSRTLYTEPFVLCVTFAGLTFLSSAVRTGSASAAVFGGALVGSGGLARVDGAAIVIGMTVALALAAFARRDGTARRRARRTYLLAVGAGLALTAIGLIEVAVDSPGYLADHIRQVVLLDTAAVVTALVGWTLTLDRPWARLRRAIARRRRAVGWIAFATVLAVGLFLMSRPLWLVARQSEPSTVVAWLQEGAEVTVDATRTYDEQSLTWIAMYLGWGIVGAAMLGAAMALRDWVVRGSPTSVLLVVVVMAPSMLYIVDVSITPDQIWAMRRFLPVTIPGFILLAVFAFQRLIASGVARVRSRRTRGSAVGMSVGTIAVFGAFVASVIFPALTWGQMFPAIEHSGRLAEAEEVCAVADGRPVVLIQSTEYLSTVRSMCDVEVVSFSAAPTAADLAEVRRVWASEVVVLSFRAEGVPWSDDPAPRLRSQIVSWPPTLNRRPVAPDVADSAIWMGEITVDGQVAPIR